jgi:predicted transposase/invertase (TIGR01784 family)
MNDRFVNDAIFKAIFGKEENKYILICLLNALLDLKGKDKISEITLLNPFIDKSYMTDKLLILDLKAKDNQGRLFNIEVQINPPRNFINRVLVYLSKLISEQFSSGYQYNSIPKTISISILDSGLLFRQNEDIHNIFRYKNIKSNDELTDVIELHFIELDKFRKEKPFDLSTRFERWLYLLKFGEIYKGGREELPKELKEEEGIPMAADAYQQMMSHEHFRLYLIERDMAKSDYISGLYDAREEGLQLGRKEGIQQGIQQANIDNARNMLKDGINREMIKKYTGLSDNELDELAG